MALNHRVNDFFPILQLHDRKMPRMSDLMSRKFLYFPYGRLVRKTERLKNQRRDVINVKLEIHQK